MGKSKEVFHVIGLSEGNEKVLQKKKKKGETKEET